MAIDWSLNPWVPIVTAAETYISIYSTLRMSTPQKERREDLQNKTQEILYVGLWFIKLNFTNEEELVLSLILWHCPSFILMSCRWVLQRRSEFLWQPAVRREQSTSVIHKTEQLRCWSKFRKTHYMWAVTEFRWWILIIAFLTSFCSPTGGKTYIETKVVIH